MTTDMLFAIVLPVSDTPLDTIADAFRNLKFDVQVVAGGSLIVSGKRQLFSDAFGHAVVVDDKQQAFFLVEGKATPDLQSKHMPSPLAKLCSATQFQHAPEFGPESF